MHRLATSPTATDLADARQRTLELVDHLDERELESQPDPLMSPLAWDLGHIAAYEDLWLNHRYAGLPLLHPELVDAYDAFETPRAARGAIEILGAREAVDYMARVRERTLELLSALGPDPVLHELVLRHELQHTETMRQAMVMRGLLVERLPAVSGTDRWIEIGAGSFTMGADGERFAYDNERPAHEVEVEAYEIAATPVTNAQWLSFVEAGGYEDRALWSPAGRDWLLEHGEPAPPDGDLDAPVCHVCWHEASAYARWCDARLPTEAEWERASGLISDLGLVWEWTASELTGYPGFAAHPYREYSEVFFDRGYLCLRGGSWATDPRVATPTFRNWDLPERRQIFAGLRLARTR